MPWLLNRRFGQPPLHRLAIVLIGGILSVASITIGLVDVRWSSSISAESFDNALI